MADRPAFSVIVLSLSLTLLLAGCGRAQVPAILVPAPWVGDAAIGAGQVQVISPETPTGHPLLALFPPTPQAGTPFPSPTADIGREAPTLRAEADSYIVRPGDSLNQIAGRFGVSSALIAAENGLINGDFLAVGQLLVIPPQTPRPSGPSDKLLPDSELVDGPPSALFDTAGVVASYSGYLHSYHETVEGQDMTGAQIVTLVAERYSVAPATLLAMLELQSGWLRQSPPTTTAATYPLGYIRVGWEGLYNQLSWAADNLNQGYYRWRAGWAGPFVLQDGASILPGQGINAGTAAVEFLLAQLYGEADWRRLATNGFEQLYTELFGNPFTRSVEPLVPADLKQPPMQLPIESGKTWSYTGGPHSAWGTYAAWAALDFAPPGNALGCVFSDEWVTAVADGVVVRTGDGDVIEDLDGDGLEQTGWVVLYMHVESRERVAPGTHLHAGDRMGHPSCEGGVSNGTHLHLARKYNGEWISADGRVPFDLDGWISAGTGTEYDGTLARNGVTLIACSCRNDENQVAR
jgi:LasA protease